MAKTLAIVSEGSKPLKNNLHERYARLRAAAQPRHIAFRKAGYTAKNDHVADANSFRLERKPGIRQRIEYLQRQTIEETLWAIHDANLADYFETYEAIKRNHEGRPETDEKGALLLEKRVRPKLLTDLPPDLAKLIEEIRVDNRGRLIPRLYSKHQANAELRKMLNISAKEAPKDITQLSDAELISTLAAQAKELGIEIDLNYRFAHQSPAPVTDGQGSQVIDHESESGTPSAAAVAPRKR
jgi:hypothetical protein